MPMGYELDKYYDSLRAVSRIMYSKQIKIFSGMLDKIGFRHADSYRLIISSINKGLYDNLGELYARTHYGNNSNNYIGHNKSSNEQDFMSPMELRMCAMAVRRASVQIDKLKGAYSLKNIQDICYSAGEEVASEFLYINQGKNEFSIRITEPVLSTKPIIKKYNHAIVMGTLPKAKKFTYNEPQNIQEKSELIYKNNQLFSQIKTKLIELGFNGSSYRARVFAKFNVGFYDTDMANTHILEITKIILSNNAEEFISIEELKMNITKLEIMLNSLQRLNLGISQGVVLNLMEKSGTNARHACIVKYKTLPELFGGFYETFIDADKKFVENKNIKNNNTKLKK